MSSRRLTLGLNNAVVKQGSFAEALKATWEKQNAITNAASGGTKGSEGKVDFRSLSKKHDGRCGILTGIVLYAMDPSKRKAPSLSGIPGNMAPPVGGGAGKPPTQSLIVAIVRLADVDTQSFHDKKEPNTTPLFSRTYEGKLEMQYTMLGEDVPGTKAKKWYPCPMSEKMDFEISEGDYFWTNIWENTTFPVGSIVSLGNVKLTRRDNAVSRSVFPQRSEFSDYYFNCDVTLLADDPYATVPLHTKLRMFWPPALQNFPTAREVALQICHRVDAISDYGQVSVNAMLRNHQEDSKEAILESLNVRHVHKKALTPTWLLSVDTNPDCTVMCCDEYDPQLLEGIANLKKEIEYKAIVGQTAPLMLMGSNQNEAPVEASKSITRFGGDGSNDDDNCGSMIDDLTTAHERAESSARGYSNLNRSGYAVNLVWPALDDFYKKPDPKDGAPYIRAEISASITSWGYPGCHFDQDYTSPFDEKNFITDLGTGLIQDMTVPNLKAAELGITLQEVLDKGLATPRYRRYRFRRTIALFKIYGNDISVGPTNAEDMAELLISHNIPFETLLEVNHDSSNTLADVSREVTKYAKEGKKLEEKIKFATSEPEKKNEQDQAKMTATSRAEMARWRDISPQEAKDIISDPASHQESAREDGMVWYQTRTTIFRMAEYLVNLGGILLNRSMMEKRFDFLQQVANEEEQVSVVNPMAIPNSEGCVYLNPLKTHLNKLGPEYAFYALVCFGRNIGHNELMKKNNMLKLKNTIQLSKMETLSETDSEKILLFLSETNARVFYYAVNTKTLEKCKVLAKKTFHKLVQRYDSPIGPVFPKLSGHGGYYLTQAPPSSPSVTVDLGVQLSDEGGCDARGGRANKRVGSKSPKRSSSVAFSETKSNTSTASTTDQGATQRPGKRPKLAHDGALSMREGTPPIVTQQQHNKYLRLDTSSLDESLEDAPDGTQDSQVWTTEIKNKAAFTGTTKSRSKSRTQTSGVTLKPKTSSLSKRLESTVNSNNSKKQ